jgi:Protein of unknown function (DUF3579)
VILGQTSDGKPFRPSDWAERLCGIMAQFRPDSAAGSHISYSPYVIPTMRGDLKCVQVDHRVHDLEPLAFNFLLSFCRDNDLQLELLEQQQRIHSKPG